MSAVIRGSGSVIGPLLMCQSFSASLKLPTSARSRKMPEQDEHFAMNAPPISRLFMLPWHFGHVMSSMVRRYYSDTLVPE